MFLLLQPTLSSDSVYHEVYELVTLTKEDVIGGSMLLDPGYISRDAVVREIHNIPLRVQEDSGCGSASLAMVMDWLGAENQTLEWYDDCLGRSDNEPSYVYQILSCAARNGYHAKLLTDPEVGSLQIGDMVIYHALNYTNDSDSHISVVDYIENDSLIIANSWGQYDVFNNTFFTKIFRNEAIRIQKPTTN